jgi:DNA-binding phage protein
MTQSLAAMIRSAIIASEAGQTAIARMSRVDRGQLYRFMVGERSITIETAEQILQSLGCKITIGPPMANAELTQVKPRKRTNRKGA